MRSGPRFALGTAAGRRGTGGRLGILAGLICALLMLLPAPAASAHAFLTSSTPADGQSLGTAPREIRLQFSESVVLSAMTLDIVDSHGQHFRPTSTRIQVGVGTEDPVEVIATVPVLGRDAYRMRWETLSSDDLHRTNGLLVFGIGTAVSAAGTVEPTPPLDEVLLRAGLFLALAVSLGGLLAARLARRAPVMGGSVDLARRCAIGSAWGSAAALLFCPALLADQVLQQGAPAGEILLSSFGLHSALREVGFVLLLFAALRRRARRPRRGADLGDRRRGAGRRCRHGADGALGVGPVGLAHQVDR